MSRLLLLNSPECVHLSIGVAAALLLGAIHVAYSLLVTQIVVVCVFCFCLLEKNLNTLLKKHCKYLLFIDHAQIPDFSVARRRAGREAEGSLLRVHRASHRDIFVQCHSGVYSLNFTSFPQRSMAMLQKLFQVSRNFFNKI